jgi:DNA-directed RNA polymerase subunit RPC12/RpoP
MPKELVGVHHNILLESVSKRLVDAIAGRGGIENVVQFLDQLDWLPEEARVLRSKIKTNAVFFEAALALCSKEMMKRPYGVRVRQISDLLGMACPKCGYGISFWDRKIVGSVCPSCGSKMESLYAVSLKQLLEKRITPSPEAVLMNVAYERLAQAYVDGYKALDIALDSLAKGFGWTRFRIQRKLLAYMDAYFYGRYAGEQKISREEKECLQFFVRGNLAEIPIEDAEALLRMGMEVVKYGYLFEVLRATGAESKYLEAVAKYGAFYDQINSQIREALQELFEESIRTAFKLRRIAHGYYHPCFLIPKKNWVSGQLEGHIILEPYVLPIFPSAEMGSIQTVYGPLGSGKTVLLSSLICYSFFKRHETVFVPLNDKSNSFSLAPIPMFPYSRSTAKLMETLERLDVEPQGIPAVTVNVLVKGEKVENVMSHPPTIYDRIVYVDNPTDFTIDFNMLFDELKAVAETFGFSQPVGILAVRNMQRETQYYYIDVEIATNMLLEFDKWRKGHMGRPMRVVLDEVSYMAASYAKTSVTDKIRAGGTITDFIKESRRNNVSVDAATQYPVEIVRELRNAATNVFFRGLQSAVTKARSPIDALLESIQLRDDQLKPVIRDMNNRGALPKHFWFWYHQPSYDINVIRPAPPTFAVFDPNAKMSMMEILREYEKQNPNQHILLKSWDEVKVVEAAKPRQPRTPAHAIPKGFKW